MADPTTILEYATGRSDDAAQAATAAQQRLAAAQSDLAQVNTDANNASAGLSDLERRAAEIRQKLSIIVTPADGAALLDALEQTIIRIRAQQSVIGKIQNRFSVAQADALQAQADLATASANLANAGAALEQATQSATDRQALSDALGVAPVATMPTEAGKALDAANLVEGAAFKAAKDRIEADIPAKLLERAEDRRAQTAALLARAGKNAKDAEDAILKERETNGGLAGKAEKLRVAFERAEADARNFVNTAKASFDQAKSLLAGVGDPARAPLTTQQRERINDAALEADREAAADAEADLDTGLAQDVSDNQALLDDAILKFKANPTLVTEQAVTDARGDLTIAENLFQAADETWREAETQLAAAFAAVDEKQVALAQAIQQAVAAEADPETDPDVITAKSELTTAQNNLKTAEDTYKISDNGRLDLWEAAVPDTTWRLFEEYEDAVEVFNALKGSNPATLKSSLKTKEEEYVAAQFAADKSAKVLAQLTAERVQRTVRQESARQSADARLFSALRGDE